MRVTPGSAASLVTGEIPERGDLKKNSCLQGRDPKAGACECQCNRRLQRAERTARFLETQHHDLVEAEATLLNIIDELETGMRKQFAEKFEENQERI